MSDSDGDLPSDATITSKLRDIVIAIHKTGKSEDLTLKRVRTRTEKELGLDEGFFKQSAKWKQKSEDTITEVVDKHCNEEPPPKKSPKKAAAKPKPKPKPAEKKTKAAVEGARGIKRKNAAPAKTPKKRRKASSDEESEAELSEPSAELSDADSEPPKKLAQRGKKVVAEDSDEEEEVTNATKRVKAPVESDGSEAEPVTPAKKAASKDDVSESELSELIDDSPPRKSKQKKALAAKKEKATAKPKAASKAKASDDPDEAEIKRLQGWLVKCGIRKVWSRDPELSKCDTAKEKIRALKNMLKDVGMDGKYSNEKAASIKEQREFAKDLAAIQEGELHWGKATEVTSTGQPSRRAAAARPPPQPKIVLSDDSDEDMNSGNKDEGSDDDDDDDVKVDSDEDSKDEDSAGDESGSE